MQQVVVGGDPYLGLAEEDEGETPGGVEPVGAARLRQHVPEVELYKNWATADGWISDV